MNILFVNYGDFSANSLNHIAPFASQLAAQGHACAVAAPALSGLDRLREQNFKALSFDQALAQPRCFPDGRGADLVHAWTPRENVRRFTRAYLRQVPARLLVHLEDNEEYLSLLSLGLKAEDLETAAGMAKAAAGDLALAHPLKARAFLASADAATVIVPSLADFLPAGLPWRELAPGLDLDFFKPRPPSDELRRELGLSEGERVIVFSGSNTFANQDEIRALYEAVALLNEKGQPTRLLRTGLYSKTFEPPLPERLLARVLDLGFVPKNKIPDLQALSSVAVQPGCRGAFNDYRLPSKLPELLALGLPVLLPPCNVGGQLKNGEEALLLNRSDAAEIAELCGRVFADAALASRLGAGARRFAENHYDLAANTRKLLAFYEEIVAAPARPGTFSAAGPTHTELGLYLRQIASANNAAGTTATLRRLAAHLEFTEEEAESLSELARTKLELTRTQAALLLANAHGENLSREREKRIELTGQHVQNLENELKATKQRIQSLEQEREAAATHIRNLEQGGEATRQHIANLEAIRQSSDQHIANIEEALRMTRQHVSHLEAEIQSLNQRSQSQEQAAALRVGELQKIVAEEEAALDKTRAELQHTREWIRTIQGSLSWKLTAPLRWFGRRLGR